MRWLAGLVLLVSASAAQQVSDGDKDIIDGLFPKPLASTTPNPDGPAHIGGDGFGSGSCLCVPYYSCDPNTKRLITSGETDGFGIIDIRFGSTNKCEHFLDVCCNANPIPGTGTVPGSGTNTGTGPGPIPEPVTQPPIKVTPPPVTPPPTLPPEQAKCGIRNPKGVDFQITGNNNREAEFAEFPWMVAVLKRNLVPSSGENLALCGASLIHPQVVMTGAHCVYKFTPDNLKIRAGEWDTQTTKERYPYQERNIKQIVIHPHFANKTVYNNIALLLLESPVTLAANVKTVCLPPSRYVFRQKDCFASGWGKTEFAKNGKFSVILKKIKLPMVPNDQCQRALRKTRLGAYFTLHETFVCAGGERGEDTCTGDGGSPLACPDEHVPNRYIQSGIVSWGIGCGEDQTPGVYANVALFRDWIDSQMAVFRLNPDSYLV